MKRHISTTVGTLVLSMALAISVTLIVSSAQGMSDWGMQASTNAVYVPS